MNAVTKVEKEKATRPCKDCGGALYYTERLGWVHLTGIYWVCPSRGANKPKGPA